MDRNADDDQFDYGDDLTEISRHREKNSSFATTLVVMLVSATVAFLIGFIVLYDRYGGAGRKKSDPRGLVARRLGNGDGRVPSAVVRPVTNVVDRVVQIEIARTNFVDKIVEVPVYKTNFVNRLVEVAVCKTNFVDKIIEVPVVKTNFLERTVTASADGRGSGRQLAQRNESVGSIAYSSPEALTAVEQALSALDVSENFRSKPVDVELERIQVVTNYVDKVLTNVVERPVEIVLDQPVTNFVKRPVEVIREFLVTNVVDRQVEVVVERPVTNVVEKTVEIAVEQVVTNVVPKTIEVFVSRPVTNFVDRPYVLNMVRPTRPVAASAKTAPAVAGRPAVSSPVARRPIRLTTAYRVREGDTVGRLGVKYGFRIPDFAVMNPGVDVNFIRVGQVVNLPGEVDVR